MASKKLPKSIPEALKKDLTESYNKSDNDFDKSEESVTVEQSYKPILLNAIIVLILQKRIWSN